MAFVINVIKWLLWTVETMYFDVVEPAFLSTVNKSSVGSISWATVLISSLSQKCHLTTTVIHCPNWPKILYKTEFIILFWNHGDVQNTMWLVNTAGLAAHIGYCWLRVKADTDPMSVKCWPASQVLATRSTAF